MGPACRRHDPRRGRVVQAQKEFGKGFPAPAFYQPDRYYTNCPEFSSLPQLLPSGAHQQSPLDHIALRGGEDWKGMSCTRAAITWEAVYLTRRVLDPGTGCPASWTAPPELSEDRPTGGSIQARPAVGPFLARLHFTSLIVPPTWVYPAARCGGLECTFARADKFICMGNRKNRLTATKLISRHARTRGTSSEVCPQRRLGVATGASAVSQAP